MKKIRAHKNLFFILLIIFIGLVPLTDLFSNGLPVTHDGQDHVARIANFYSNLGEGVLVPRWAGNLNWGYGHPILMFLYPMPSYTTSLIHFLGFPLVESVKILFGLAYIISGVAMYLWLREVFEGKGGKDIGALVGACLYMFAPYRFVDLYVRGAIGEHVAFVFPPLVFYFILKLSQTSPRPSPIRRGGVNWWYAVGAALSLAGLILSHNAISLMFLPLIILYVIYLAFQTSYKRYFILASFFSIILGFGLSAFFWLPAFLEGKYTLRDIVTSADYSSRFVPVKDFLFGDWSFGGSGLLSKQVGIVQWLLVLLSLPVMLIYTKKNKKDIWFLIGSLVLFVLTLFIMTGGALFIWDALSILQKFQFPWRFLSVVVFLSALIGGLALSHLSGRKGYIITAVCIVALLLFNKDYWHAKDYLKKPVSFYTGIYNSTTDTGESSPIWSVRFMEKRASTSIEVIEGAGDIRETKRTNTHHSYVIDVEEKVRVRENTLYFPGWLVLVDSEPVSVEFQDPEHRGLMTFFVEPGRHTIDIVFTETKLRLLANWISVGSVLVLVVVGVAKGFTSRKTQRRSN